MVSSRRATWADERCDDDITLLIVGRAVASLHSLCAITQASTQPNARLESPDVVLLSWPRSTYSHVLRAMHVPGQAQSTLPSGSRRMNRSGRIVEGDMPRASASRITSSAPALPANSSEQVKLMENESGESHGESGSAGRGRPSEGPPKT